MPNSLKVKLSKLRYKGNITNDEYQELIKKLDGHDKQIRADAIDECINEIGRKCDEQDLYLPIHIRDILEQLKENNNG